VHSKREAKDAKQEHDHEEMNEETDKAENHQNSRTQSENNQAHQIDTTNRSTTQRRGMLQGPKK
jgi:hypothetical protein